MARPRAIKPTIWEDSDFTSRTIGARLLWIGMFSNADDEGYILANFKNLRRLIFGFDDPSTISHLKSWIEELKEVPSIHFFDVGGEEYAHFTKWHDHQKQQKDRIQPSAYPKCNKCLTDDKQMSTEVKLSKENINMSFEKFWSLFPKKVAKKKAEQAWVKIAPEEHEKIYTHIQSWPTRTTWASRREERGFLLVFNRFFHEVLNINVLRLRRGWGLSPHFHRNLGHPMLPTQHHFALRANGNYYRTPQ